MYMKKVTLMLLFTLPLLLGACKNKQSKQQTDKQENREQLVGADKDEHGCIGSAGYVWSEVLQKCVRPWEVGVKLNAVEEDTNSAIIIFSPDSLQVELMIANRDNQILDRRGIPTGFAWNQEDDDTFNLRCIEGKWRLEKRQKLVYIEPDKSVKE